MYGNCNIISENKFDNDNVGLQGLKPILRPLSDLTKEIEIEGLIFNPMDLLDGYQQVGGDGLLYILLDGSCWTCNPSEWSHSIVRKIISWHFDIHNLIPQGLAIDIKTLKNER